MFVKVTDIDDKGRLNLSKRAAMIEIEGIKPENNNSHYQKRHGLNKSFSKSDYSKKHSSSDYNKNHK